MKRTAGLLLGVAAGIVLLLGGLNPVFAQNSYVITLKDGRSLTTSSYQEKDDQILIQKFGGTMALNKADIVEIISENAVNRGPSQAGTETTQTSSRSKKKPSEMTPEEKLDKDIEGLEQSIKLHYNSMAIYCGQAAYAETHIPAAPNIPKTSVAHVSPETGEQFKKHVQGKVDAYKASSSCDFYKKKIPEMEKKLEEMKRLRGH